MHENKRYQESVVDKYPELILLLFDEPIIKKNDKKIREFLLSLRSENKLNNKYFIDYIKKLLFNDNEKYLHTLKESCNAILFCIKHDI